ncbi:MAG: 2-keto-3-deoxy-L-rhamnonate aldolase, partial [Agrobacterium tumefaciens]
ADMGHRGNPTHPEVMQAVETVIGKGVAAGKPVGIMSGDPAMLAMARKAGIRFFASSTDVSLLSAAAANLAASMRG